MTTRLPDDVVNREKIIEEIKAINKKILVAESKRNQAEKEMRELDEKIKRLEKAKYSVHNLKIAFKNVKADDKNTIDWKRRWKGTTFTNYQKVNGESLKSQNDAYYKEIDRIEDALIDEIRKYEIKRNHKKGIIGDVLSTISYYQRAREKLFN